MRIANYGPVGPWLVTLDDIADPGDMALGRDPQRWLADGDVLTSHIEGIGEMRHRFVAGPPVRKEI